MPSLPDDALPLLDAALADTGPIVFLTGAGISAESGIPTFRGPEGFWQVGSRNYRPLELATWSAFQQMPDNVWAWYLYRRAVCRAAEANPAHLALAKLEEELADRFLLVTQNVDGLHVRAGNSLARTFQIHGNLDFMRCSRECTTDLVPMPQALGETWEKGQSVGDREREMLRCPSCGERARPHVLWFDETYDEGWFRFESSLRSAVAAALLVIVGTSGATNLPMQMGMIAARRGAPMLVLNPEPSPFSQMADANPAGLYLEGTAGELVPELVNELRKRGAR